MTFDFAPQLAFTFMLIFGRIGTMIMVMPGIGERGIPARLRLAFALALCVVMFPALQDSFATLPPSLFKILELLGMEIAVGLFIGVSIRLVMSALQVAGSAIAMQTGPGFAQTVATTQGIQSATFASFISVTPLTLVMLMDLHHMLIAAVVDSYQLFRPGAPIPVSDFAQMAIATISGSFAVAVQMSAPFLAFGLVFYMGIGVLSRLMPQAQIFFVALPVNILIGFLLFMFLMAPIMSWFLGHFEETVSQFLK